MLCVLLLQELCVLQARAPPPNTGPEAASYGCSHGDVRVAPPWPVHKSLPSPPEPLRLSTHLPLFPGFLLFSR